jgi:uncharacterized protein YggU (UPF0235/DUF167 family)
MGFMSAKLGVGKRAVLIISGQTSRVRLAGVTVQQLLEKVQQCLSG